LQPLGAVGGEVQVDHASEKLRVSKSLVCLTLQFSGHSLSDDLPENPALSRSLAASAQTQE
jgi:hypothetical protein